MTKNFLAAWMVLAAVAFIAASASAQDRTTPITAADLEAAYTARLERRTADILEELAFADRAKSNRVTDILIRHYRALRARDDVINAAVPDSDKTDATRMKLYQSLSKPLQEQFIAKLTAELTPDELGKVKDKMTYNRLQANYDSYCTVISGLSDEEKAKIMEVLKEARDEAMEGGSSTEKAEIFQKYKDKINEYLTARGHDVVKAYAEWRAKQGLAKTDDSSKSNTSAPVQ
jgi:hypothetical protein